MLPVLRVLRLKLWLLALVLALGAGPALLSSPLLAQVGPGPAEEVDALTPPDYKSWERTAARAEKQILDRTISSADLDQMRQYLVQWRETFLRAQGINATRIASTRGQSDALGPPPPEGETEPEDIAERRKQLAEQLTTLRAPVVAAEEAYQRADGLIQEIDRVLRERQTEEMLRLWPMPINPANWPATATAMSEVAMALYAETAEKAQSPEARAEAGDNLPAIVGLVALGLLLIGRGRALMESLTQRLQDQASARGRKVWALLVSLGQIVLPTGGTVALAHGLELTAMAGPIGGKLLEVLPAIGFILFSAAWLAGRIFPKASGQYAPLNLSPERRTEGRFDVIMFGPVIAVDALRLTLFEPAVVGDAVSSVLSFPPLVVASLLLVRIGQLMLRHIRNDTAQDEPATYRNGLIALLSRGAVIIGIVGPLLAAIGYVSAATALVYPAAVSLALVGVLFVLQTLVADVYGLATRNEDGGREALLPVLISFVLALAMLPLLALVWGARLADLTEIWARFREGFQLGATRISPTNFLLLIVIFAIGYGATRLFQGALKTSILPKTKLDQGGQNAAVAGVGYIGIFLAALVAINATGIDLSGLAIVAGALTVGIGFGMQNIVSNFVSGIILLIERPVSEGDWIEVGGVQGTVKAISVRSTRIQTFDRTDVIVPNTDLIAGQVTNWTRYNMTGRLIVPIGVAYGSDTRHVEKVLREIAEAQPLAILNPPPAIIFMGYAQDMLNFEIRVILRDVNFSLSVRSDINHCIAQRFAEEGIGLPYIGREIWPPPPPVDGLDEDELIELIRPAVPRIAAQKDEIPKDTRAVSPEEEDAEGADEPDEGSEGPR